MKTKRSEMGQHEPIQMKIMANVVEHLLKLN